MTVQALSLFKTIFSKCAEWTTELFDAVGGAGVVTSAFCIVLAIGLLFLPMRGRMGADSFVNDYQQYSRHKATDEYRQKHMEYHKNKSKKSKKG